MASHARGRACQTVVVCTSTACDRRRLPCRTDGRPRRFSPRASRLLVRRPSSGDRQPWRCRGGWRRRFSADGTWDRIHTRLLVEADSLGQLVWTVSVGLHDQSRRPARDEDGPHLWGTYRTTRICRSNLLTMRWGGPRGGLSTKIHHLADSKGRSLVMLVAPGLGGDSRMFAPLLEALSVPRAGPAGLAPDPIRSWVTRPTPPRRTGSCSAGAASPLSSLNQTTRSATADAAVPAAVEP